MKSRDVALAVLVAVLWGLAFAATRIALDSFTPPQLTALRFLIAAAPAVALPRPPLGWSMLIAIGLTLFTGQFLFQFSGMASGMPPGLTSVMVQTQAFFTVLFAAAALGEQPARRQIAGMAAAFLGVVLIALTLGGDITLGAFVLTLLSAVSWAIGNVLLKRVARVEMLPLVAWLSLVPPLPSLGLALALDGPTAVALAVPQASLASLGAALYLGLVATVYAYAAWGDLLRRHAAATVAPFALLAPFVGALSSAALFGERFGLVRLAGMALVLVGLVLVVSGASPAPAAPARGSRRASSPRA